MATPEQQPQRGARWMLLAAISLVLVLAQLMLATPRRRTAQPSRCGNETRAAPGADPDEQGSFFYLVTLREAEEQAPWLAGCGLTVFAAVAYQHLESSPRRTMDPGRAVLWVWPTYTAWETNWPEYGAGFRGRNIARPGSQCAANQERVFEGALASRQRLLNATLTAGGRIPRMLLLDSWPWYPWPSFYRDERLAFAKLNALEGMHRPGIDVSMPPPSHTTLQFVQHQALPDAAAAEAGPAGRAPRHLLTFKGNFNTNRRWRGRLGALHNPAQGVIVIDTAKEAGSLEGSSGSSSYDYAELMATSKFTAVIRGDVEFSYRFTEAVCSGAVPLLLSDGWVPPLNGTVPFHTYGVAAAQAEIGGALVERLRSMPPAEHARLRENALHFCHRHVGSVFQAVESLIEEALSNVAARPGGNGLQLAAVDTRN